MNIFTEKGLFKKLIIIIIAITLFSAIIPPNVTYAAEDVVTTLGGSLLSPVASLMIGLGDAVMNLLHDVVYDMDNSYILLSNKSDFWGVVLTILAAVAAVVVIAVIAYFTAGAGLAVLAKLGIVAAGTKIGVGAVGTIVAVSLASGAVAGTLTAIEWFGDNVIFPIYQISPEEIFKGEVALLDVNFFKDKEDIEDEDIDLTTTMIGNQVMVSELQIAFEESRHYDVSTQKNIINRKFILDDLKYGEEYINKTLKKYGYTGEYIECPLTGTKKTEKLKWGNYEAEFIIDTPATPQTDPRGYISRRTYTLTIKQNGQDVLNEPIEIEYSKVINDTNTSGEITIRMNDTEENLEKIALDRINSKLQEYNYNESIDIFSENMWTNGEREDEIFKWSNDLNAYEANLKRKTVLDNNGTATTSTKSTVTYTLNIYKGEWIGYEKTTLGLTLNPTVSKWYYAIRNFVLVVMMVILLYIGIRIILAGVSNEKAKYKNMLMDWLVAICLVFVMHYIMSFSMNVVDGIRDIFSTMANGEENYINIYELNTKLYDGLKEELQNNFSLDINDYLVKNDDGTDFKNDEGNRLLQWNAGNIVGIARIQAALCESGNITYIGYAMAYVVLVFFTLFFFFTYIKRALYLTFFTIIAPLVAMTYPIDKMHDGKAQAFDMWLKEYIFNLMIQPVHLLLYTVLISSAFELASSNIFYTLTAIGFMMPAEKFIRKMFGFDKAQTPGFLGGAAGAALMMTGMNKLFNRRPSKSGGGKGDDDDDKSSGQKSATIHKNPNKGLLGQAPGAATPNGHTTKVTPRLKNNVINPQKKVTAQPKKIPLTNGGTTRVGGKKITVTSKGKGTGASNGAPTGGTNTNQPSFLQRHKSAIKAASGDYIRHKLKRTAKNIQNGKPIKDLARFAGGAYLGLGGALLGATAGLMSGEAKNITGYGATLGTAGYALGSKNPQSDPDVESAYQEYLRESAENPEEYALEQQRRQIVENEKNLRKIKDNLGLSSLREAQQVIEEYGDCIDYGITDMDDLATIIKLEQDGKMDREMGTVASQYYKKAGGKPKNMAPDSKEMKHIKHICEDVARSNGLQDQADIDASVKVMLSNLDLYGKYKDGLTEV